MGLGELQLPAESFWDMTGREFFSALSGKRKADQKMHEANRNLLFSAQRYHASTIAGLFDKKSSRAIQRQNFPWEKRKTEAMDFDQMTSIFNMISKKPKE